MGYCMMDHVLTGLAMAEPIKYFYFLPDLNRETTLLQKKEFRSYDQAVDYRYDENVIRTDLLDVHIVYDYESVSDSGVPQKWRYESRYSHKNRIVYAIHGGPMAGRQNYQEASYQCIRPGEIWQCNFLEETGTIVSQVYDIPNRKITTFIALSKGHWERPTETHGDKRNMEDFTRWRELAKDGIQTGRYLMSKQADIIEVFRGPGNLIPIDETWDTL